LAIDPQLQDEQAQAPWLWSAQRRHFTGHDDPQSLRANAVLVREKGLGGIMYRHNTARMTASNCLMSLMPVCVCVKFQPIPQPSRNHPDEPTPPR
jgi:hypothetical protein